MNRTLRVLWLAALSVLSHPALGFGATDSDQAQRQVNVSVLSGFSSRHLSERDYNETNTGIGFRLDAGRLEGWSAGFYRNSLNRTSLYAGKAWSLPSLGPVRASVFTGAVTGYARIAPVLPVALPEVALRLGRRLEFAVVVSPVSIRGMPPLVALQLRQRL